ncbi:MAG: Gfo/Idh/MocA family protein [Gemmataceae bacterium]
MTQRNTRRDFLKASAGIGAGLWVAGSEFPSLAKPLAANDKINVAIVGCGGRGGGNLNSIAGSENIVALCDVDDQRAAGAYRRFPNVPKFKDFRQMLDEVRTIDAVAVSTPDHTHAPISIAAMKLGKHVYCEKPLTHSVWEARQMRLVADRMNLITQMGNQGTATNGLREGVEVIQSGAIGPVREVHVWTNRPIWPQGVGRLPEQQVPNHLDWDLWLGPAPLRPYNSGYVPFKWRGWWDFGTGAIGDMACHTMNLAFMALKLEAPTRVSAEVYNFNNNETAPMGALVTYEFPARGDMPPVVMKWYERSKPPRELFQGQRPSGSGCLMIGTNGTMYSPSDYGSNHRLLPLEQFRNYQRPEQKLPRATRGHHREWLDGIRSNRRPFSNFVTYASQLTETALLGNVAMRIGVPFRWDTETLTSPDCPKVARFIRREYRRGWEL